VNGLIYFVRVIRIVRVIVVIILVGQFEMFRVFVTSDGINALRVAEIAVSQHCGFF
jgi:hypothetical protein